MQSKNNEAKGRLKIDWSKSIVYFAFLGMFLFFWFLLKEEGFRSSINLLNITRQTAMISIMAVGMTFVIGAEQIDLSIGATAALSALITALALQATNSIIVGLIAGLALGALTGMLNGVLITVVGIPSFLVTLGTMGIIRGFAMWITGTAAVPILNQNFNFWFGSGQIVGIPVLLPWTILFLIFGHLLLKKTVFGKKVLATGGNEMAASFTGIKTKKIKFMTLTMSGILAAFAGILYAGRMQTGRYTFGEGDELSVIAAVILGGTAMSGGVGSVVGSVVGSLLMGMINNGLILAGLEVSQQNIVRGVIIILAVALGSKSQKNK
jgi:ribose transport system permease protein